MRRSTLAALSACVLGAGLALAAAAPAQTPPPAPPSVTVDRSCYAPGDTMTRTARGFTPNAQVLEIVGLFPVNGGSTALRLLSTVHTADAAGGFVARIRAPNLARSTDRREFAASAFTDQSVPEPAPGAPGPDPPTAAWILSAWDIDIPQWAGRTANPRRSMTIDTFEVRVGTARCPERRDR